MTPWTGTASTTPAVVGGAAPCVAYLTVAQIRAEYGDDVADKTDAALQRQIDQMAAQLEDQLGHTFGRALLVYSASEDTVIVTATSLTVGGDEYTFADYATLGELVDALNDADTDYAAELLANVQDNTPSTLLNTLVETACGPDYEDRVFLCTSAMYYVTSGKNESHLFLPLPLTRIVSVTENGTEVTSDYYWAVAGESWLIKRACSCAGCGCQHARGRWSNCYPGNIAVTYVPRWWGRAPTALTSAMLEAFSSRGGLMPFVEEHFGDYSYKRGQATFPSWQELLGGQSVRRYSTRFHP